ncbi:MAG: meso-butanediol dehydrogenase/(S,S)-butanediol dehydrogenase/diacetyl reductase [Halioglobus sp.]
MPGLIDLCLGDCLRNSPLSATCFLPDAYKEKNMQRFQNKVAIVTGASSGLGAAVARQLVAEGATVLGIARNLERLEEVAASTADHVGEMHCFVADQSDPAQCEGAIEQAVQQFSQLDILINNAGAHVLRHTTDVSPQQWQEDLGTNLSGPFYFCRYALPYLLKAAGNIVNVSSLAGQQGQPYSAGYCAAKHGVIGLTRALALEYTHEDIRINAVCPGGMMTPQIENFSAPDGVDFDLVLRSAAPRGMMEAEQVAETIAYVASAQASALHGAIIMADNGKTVG